MLFQNHVNFVFRLYLHSFRIPMVPELELASVGVLADSSGRFGGPAFCAASYAWRTLGCPGARASAPHPTLGEYVATTTGARVPGCPTL